MEKNNIIGLLNFVKEKSSKDYPKLMNQIEFLMSERIKLVGNDLRNFLGTQTTEIDKEKIEEVVISINDISASVNHEFFVKPDWSHIENFLRLSILDDLGKEFDKQKNI